MKHIEPIVYGDKRGGHILARPFSGGYAAWYYRFPTQALLRWVGFGNSPDEAVADLWYKMHKWDDWE